MVVLLVGLAATLALCLTALALYDRNESRLLDLRARELGLVLTATIPSLQTPLASAAELADGTGGNAQKFRTFMAPYVGPGRQYASASLWPLNAQRPSPTVVVGKYPLLASLPNQAYTFFRRAAPRPTLGVTGVLGSTHPSLGYEFNTPGVPQGFAVYAESPLPSNRRSRLESNSAFSELNYALYLGRGVSSRNLLVTSLSHLPISGRKASTAVPFGDKSFTLVVSPRGSLSGSYFKNLPWIVAIVGALISVAAAIMTERLVRRRQSAVELAGTLDRVAGENRRMYAEQRSIAQTLQHALLPETLPEVSGLQVSARYVPASPEIDVGGDWYDVVKLDDQTVLVVLGDVSGHGLRAATTMASLRHAALAYAAQDPRPATVLARLAEFVNREAHEYFATVLCVLVDLAAHELRVASAGHLPPLLIDGDDAVFVAVRSNAPIGVGRDLDFQETVVDMLPHATLLAFTDGLVERRGEVIDEGLARLRAAARAAAARDHPDLDELVTTLEGEFAVDDHRDDTAIVGLRLVD